MQQNCTAESDRELSCIFPAISSDLLDDIINETLELRYSLVAASVPGLGNLHLMSQFSIEFVDDPVINCFTEPMSYRAGSNAPITIAVSICECILYSAIFDGGKTLTDLMLSQQCFKIFAFSYLQ